MPTFLEMAGLAPATRSQALDGSTFAPVLGDPALPGKPAAFGEYALPNRPFYLWRSEHWKYVHYTDATSGRGPAALDERMPAEELYDPVADPAELTNLASDPTYAGIVAEQRAHLFAFLEQQGAAGALVGSGGRR